MCNTHYEQLRRAGLIAVNRRVGADRFWSHVDKGRGCWTWTGARSTGGYGRVHWNGRGLQAHRVAYELLVGPIPDGLQLDHLCRNRACVRPGHLEPVTLPENLARGVGPSAINSLATTCPQGHPYDGENTYAWRSSRMCRACRTARVATHNAAREPKPPNVTTDCAICGGSFTYQRGRAGRIKKVCSPACAAERGRRASREHQRRKRAVAT